MNGLRRAVSQDAQNARPELLHYYDASVIIAVNGIDKALRSTAPNCYSQEVNRMSSMDGIVPQSSSVSQPLEEWRDVPGYEGCYQVSDLGHVRSLKRPKAKGKLLKLHRMYKSGYWVVRLQKPGSKQVAWLVHRLVAFVFLGLSRSEEVDHINLNKDDNRLENLRKASHGQNRYNMRRQKNNTSGYKGVSYRPKERKWQAYIYHNRKCVHLGTFSTPEEAHAAYCIAAEQYAGEFARFS